MSFKAIPPLIQSDSLVSKLLTSSMFTNKLALPSHPNDQILDPIPGMLIFNSSTNELNLYDGTGWIVISTTGPYVQQGSKLVGTGETGSNIQQGISVSLSSDNNTLAIGGSGDNSGIGATWVFTRSAGVWTQQGSKLVGSGYIGSNIQQGFSVSLSADGNTLAIGGYRDNNILGATWIFTRSAGVWTQQGSKLIGTGYTGSNIGQGVSVSLSADGNTLAIGGVGDNTVIGATWIFTRSTGVWTQQGSKLVGSGYTGSNINQGNSVSLSTDGNTLAIGGNGDNGFIGATWIFTRSAGVWTQQGSKLVGSGYIGSSNQGYSVAVRGNTLVVGAVQDNNYIGATWVFKRSAGVWTQQGSKLVGTGYVGSDIEQGSSVSINDTEDILITGGGYDNNSVGAIWVFKLVNGVWTQFNQKLVVTGYVSNPDIGYYPSDAIISGDGTTIVAAGQDDRSGNGSTWIFTNS
jgi:hypothetical protein